MISSNCLPDSVEFVTKPTGLILTKSQRLVELVRPGPESIQRETRCFLEKRKKPRLSCETDLGFLNSYILTNRIPIGLLGWWQDDRIDDMDHTIARIDIGAEDLRTVDVSSAVLNGDLDL